MNLNIPYPKQIFVYGDNHVLGVEIAKKLKTKLSGFEVKKFSDGESIPHQTETVRDRDVFIIFTSLNYEIPYSSFVEYLVFVRSIKSGQPHRITVIIPKQIWQRQDVENRELREPKLSGFFAELLKTAGMDCMVVLRLHNPASCTTDPPMENVDTTKLIIDHILSTFHDKSKIVIGAADMGGSKYSRKIARSIGTPLVIVDKEREPKTGKTIAINVYTEGKIDDKVNTVIFVDDIINSFGSLKDAGDALFVKFPQINNYLACATHPDFSPDTLKNILDSKFSKIWVTDTVPINKQTLKAITEGGKEIEIISVAELIYNVIENLHNGESVSDIWNNRN